MMPTRVHVIAHTHWDREWYQTFEQYRARLVDLVDGVLERMAADPRFTFFHLDGQAVVLEDYLEIRPEREQELRQRISEGRLLVGPWYVMPDMFLVSGEALVRNLALGIRTAVAFGGAMRVGYMPDPFGHVAQMPQILAGFQLAGAILWRGFGGRGAEYWWEAPDGTRVLLLHLPPEGYCNGLRLPLLPADRQRAEAAAILAREAGRSVCGRVLLMMGVDHVEPHPALLQVLDLLQEAGNGGPRTARLSTLPAYVADVAAALTDTHARLEVVHGELRGGEDYAHLLPGVLSARTYLKQANARVQRDLERYAEPISALALLGGLGARRGMLQYAWRTLLQNHPHDSICGCSIDPVHQENLTRFSKAQEAVDVATSHLAGRIGARLPAAPAGALRCVLFNTDSTAWSGIVEGTIEVPLELAEPGRDVDASALEDPITFFGSNAQLSSVTDCENRLVPFQVTAAADAVSYRMSRYAPPVPIRVRRVEIALALESLPPLGYAAIDLHVSDGPGSSAPDPRFPSTGAWLDDGVLENEFVRVEARKDGTLDVLDKRTHARYEGVFMLEDSGDVGDEYTYSPPSNDRYVTNRMARVASVRPLLAGPLLAALSIELVLPVPVAASSDRASRLPDVIDLPISLEVRLRAASPIVECVARVDNRARDHRLRLVCPTGAATVDRHRADTAFGVAERMVRRPVPPGPLREQPAATAPMQSFVDAGDDSVGAVIIADGLTEYEVIRGQSCCGIALTLIRAVGDLSRDDLTTREGHAGPGLPAPGAQCLGPREFRVAFAPRAAVPPAGELFRMARAVLAPPRLFSPCGGDGSWPVAQSWFRLDADPDGSVILSACKVADERSTVVVRMFNVTGEPATVTLSPSVHVGRMYLTNLAEDRGVEYVRRQGAVRVDFAPWEIQTFECVPDAGERHDE